MASRSYGSEYRLHWYLRHRLDALNKEVGRAVGCAGRDVAWLPFPVSPAGRVREFRALEWLGEALTRDIKTKWREYWPQTGKQQNWDAVARAGQRWILVEAKANHPEFCSPPTRPTSAASLAQITLTLGRLRRHLKAHRYFDWTGTYYQYANRLAALRFAREEGFDACAVFIYFYGETFPDGTECPDSPARWHDLIEARRLTLGLPREHALSPFERDVFLPVIGGA